jgi:hypothetical protein
VEADLVELSSDNTGTISGKPEHRGSNERIEQWMANVYNQSNLPIIQGVLNQLLVTLL